MAKRKPAATVRRKPARKSSGIRRTRVVARKAAGRKAGAKKTRKTAARRSKTAAPTARKSAKKSLKRQPKPTPAARKAAARKSVSKPVARKSAAPAPVRKVPNLDRARRTVINDDIVQTPPSSLNLDRTASSARTGRREMLERLGEHTETSPAMTAGDVDADWEGAYSTGDEAPGGDNPTPDQDVVDDIGKAVGVQYEDNEELKGEEKIAKRDKHRWELDPASAEDYKDH
jgi:hypothetical protein